MTRFGDGEMFDYYPLLLLVILMQSKTFQSESLDANSPKISPLIDGIKLSSAGSKHITVVTLQSPPFMMKREINNTVQWYGYCMDFFEELIRRLPYNLTYQIYEVADNKFGSKNKQVIVDKDKSGKVGYKRLETWNGLVGDLHSGKADLALGPMAVMAERELAIDFTVPFYDLVGIQILLRKPKVDQDWFKFLTVLDNEVWLSITIAYFVISFVMFMFDRLSPYSHKNQIRIQNIKKLRNVDQDPDPKRPSSVGGEYEFLSHIEPVTRSNTRHMNGIRPHVGFPRSKKLSDESNRESKTGDVIGRPRRKSSVFLNHILKRRLDTDLHYGKLRFNRRRVSDSISDYTHIISSSKSRGSINSSAPMTNEVHDGRPQFNLRESLWFCITSLTPQGGGEAPQNLSGRVVAGAWWLFCFIIIASYTANLAAFLTVSRLDIPIDNLDDLAKQYKIKYAPIDGTAEQTYFERMAYIEEIFYKKWREMSLNDSLSEEERSKFAVWDYPISDKYTKIWAQVQQVGMPSTIGSAIQRVRDSSLEDGFALLADANMVKYVVMTDCDLKAVGDEFSRKPIALGLRKGIDEFKDDLSYAILQLINQRFMEVLREKWWTNNPDRLICTSNEESEGISIENIGGVFVIIFAGVILSFVAWAVERFFYKTKILVFQDMIQNASR